MHALALHSAARRFVACKHFIFRYPDATALLGGTSEAAVAARGQLHVWFVWGEFLLAIAVRTMHSTLREL